MVAWQRIVAVECSRSMKKSQNLKDMSVRNGGMSVITNKR